MAFEWTYRKKNKMLLVTASILLLLTYMLSIKKTIALHGEVIALETQWELAANAPAQAAQLKEQLKEIDNMLGAQAQAGNIQQALLGTITGYCQENNTVLREFPKTVYDEEKDLVIETNVFTVEGSFTQLLKLIHLLEQQARTGKVSSARYFIKKDPRTRTSALNATIYLQNIKKPDHEK